jgi:hypothetical protein
LFYILFRHHTTLLVSYRILGYPNSGFPLRFLSIVPVTTIVRRFSPTLEASATLLPTKESDTFSYSVYYHQTGLCLGFIGVCMIYHETKRDATASEYHETVGTMYLRTYEIQNKLKVLKLRLATLNIERCVLYCIYVGCDNT